MAAQPKEDDISQVMMIIDDITREEAIARLKGNNNNADQAINEYYDDVEGSRRKYRWDESQFHADREGLSSSPGVSFEIQGPDELAPASSGRFDGAMSRPPSRVNNRSPLGKVIDLTAEHASAGVQNSMYFSENDQQDDALQRALAESRMEAGLPPQQSGTTSMAEVHFGPATKDQYESGKWDMVLAGAGKVSTQEILVDPEPTDRKRDLDVPAFLKPSVTDHRLAALVTMYHEIPMARELFIDRNSLLPSYGNDPEWWNGQQIKSDSVSGVEADDEYEWEVNFELQRLMAFLDKTDRSYGSVEALAGMRDVKRAQRQSPLTREVESAVLAAWKAGNESKPGRVKQIFSKGVQSEAREDDGGEIFAILELSLPSKDSYSETIYDIADNLLWPEFGHPDLNESAYLSHIADVIVFNISADHSDHKKINIPPVWYPNRYMQQHREAAWEMRTAKRAIHEEIQTIASIEDKLTMFQARNGKILKVSDMLTASLRHDEAQLEANKVVNGDDDIDVPFKEPGKTAELSAKLQQVVAGIDKKLKDLNEEKEKALASMRELSLLLTKEAENLDTPKLNKYFLRGVSTAKDVTYICRRAEPDLIEMDLDGDVPKKLGDQWWRCAYVVEGGNARVAVNKITLEEVLEAAKSEGPSKVLLMYASEKAMDWPITALPPPLETFVRWDNACFKREFLTTNSEDQVSSPGKRKFDDSDASSPITRESDREFRLNGEPHLGWGGAQPSSRDISSRLNGVQDDAVPIIFDPTLLNGDHGCEENGQEMQERGGISMLGQMRRVDGDVTMGTIDSMDLDDTVMEDSDTVEPSPAVKRVEFKD